MMITSSKCHPRNSAVRFWLTLHATRSAYGCFATDPDKRIDLQNVVRQLGRDRTSEVAGPENKPEFHRGWHDEQRRECNFHHTEQSKITSDSELRHLLGNPRIVCELQYAQKRARAEIQV